MIVIDTKQYETIRSERVVEVPYLDKVSLKDEDIVFLYIENENKVVAEYDIDEVTAKKSKLNLTLEPIYNSPIGVEMTDLLLLTMPNYSLKEWKRKLQNNIFPISEHDATELVNRLKL